MEATIRLEMSYPDGASGEDGPKESSYHPLVSPMADIGRPCHYPDYMAGTSTEGFIAIMPGRLIVNVDDSILASKA